MMVARSQKKGEMESLMNTEFQFGKIKKVLEIDGGNGCISM